MSQDKGPHVDRWADLLRPTYGYSDDLYADIDEDVPRRRQRRQRRRARRQWRQSDKAARKDWIDERRRDLAAPEEREVREDGVLTLLVVFLAAVAVVVLVRGCGDGDEAPAPAPTSSTTAPAAAPTRTASPTPTPSPTVDVQADDVDPVNAALIAWAEAWFAFSPTQGDTDLSRLTRAEPFMTDELGAFLFQTDDAADYYAAEGIDLAVVDAVVAMPEPGSVPVDHDLRATRLLAVTTRYETGPDAGTEFVSAYAVALYRAAASDPWLVGDYVAADH